MSQLSLTDRGGVSDSPQVGSIVEQEGAASVVFGVEFVGDFVFG